MRELHGSPQPRAQPAGEQERVGLRPRHRQRLHSLDLGPEPREPAAPAEAAPPGDVRDGDPVEERRELRVGAGKPAPLGRVDDEPVADVDELLELRLAPRRQPAPAAERRQVGDQERRDDRAGDAGALPPSRSSITSEQTSRARPGDREALQRRRRRRSRPPCGRRGRAGSCATGAAPRARRASGGRQQPTAAAPRRRGSSRSSASPSARALPRSSARRFSTCGDDAGISAAASCGRRGGSARRRPPGPSCPPRSSGSSGGRASRRRRSRRRAPTARRPRPRA